MGIFTQHTPTSAPEGAADVLAKVKERYGFIPNLAAFAAESPLSLDSILKLSGAFDKASLTPTEQQIVLLTVSTLNGCSYCKTVHTGLGRMAEVDEKILQAVTSLTPLPDPKHTALRDFTRKVVEERGWVAENDVQQFLAVGYSRAQVFEVVMGVALKTFTNYCNHLAGAEPNPEFIMMAEGRNVA